ncbi:sensor histidine kinase [Mesobacterium pallidum]|uniref:sensor histidine kinase n=1 Tax=Mesobacterium pallidum TaxID=2872037 RepID=UPI001EE2997E|nr:sensor histidine kinase [Mesobacterium pallidum]
MTRPGRASDGLAFRVAAMLAVALLPLGLIAVWQTAALIDETRAGNRSDLLALTSEAAGGEESQLRFAFGAARAVAAMMPDMADSPDCSDRLASVVNSSGGAFTYISFVEPDGIARCGSNRQETDLSQRPAYLAIAESARPHVMMVPNPTVSGEPVVVLGVPVSGPSGPADYLGHVLLSVPVERLYYRYDGNPEERPLEIITFNADGDVLSAENGLDRADLRLPAGHPLDRFVGQPQTSFIARNRLGEERIFAVVPIVPGLVYALGSWQPATTFIGQGALRLAVPLLFPLLMWVASLAVAYVTVARLVIRPTRNLRARMLMFMRSRAVMSPNYDMFVPRELREIEGTWIRIAESVIQDEAEMEDVLRDKEALLREVHHRVKNNLQLIASILNMKIRKSRDNPEARTALKEVQERVMSLATVHRNLYETTLQGRVRADELLEANVSRIVQAGLEAGTVTVDSDFAPVILYPDQAVPLSLIAAEVLNNALKYLGRPADGTKPRIGIQLRQSEDGKTAHFRIENTLGTRVAAEIAPSSGLGSQLVSAFATQLDGTLEISDGPDLYVLELTFPLMDKPESFVP